MPTGRKPIEGAMLAFNPLQQPLVGNWRQSGEVGCMPGLAGQTTGPLSQFEMTPDGHFRWRRQNFELRYDAWGRYSHDVRTGAVEFQIEGGNETRGLKSMAGRAQVTDDGHLEMSSLVFAPGSSPDSNSDSNPSSPEPAAAPNCRWTFVR